MNAARGGTEVGRFSVVMRVMDWWCIGLYDGIGEDGLRWRCIGCWMMDKVGNSRGQSGSLFALIRIWRRSVEDQPRVGID